LYEFPQIGSVAIFAPVIIPSTHNRHRREHCVASLDRIKKIGKNIGEQVRIERPTENGTVLALYTVVGDHDRESDIVFVGYKVRR
jgi:hypothetical protein